MCSYLESMMVITVMNSNEKTFSFASQLVNPTHTGLLNDRS